MQLRLQACASVMLAMLLVPAMPAGSVGSGSYPPPSSGDWMITEDTYVANETIYLNGNISVQNCNLTLDMVLLRGNVSGGALTVTVDADSSFTARFCLVDVGNSASLTFDLNGTVEIHNSIFQGESGENLFIIRSNATIRNCDIEGSLIVSEMARPTLNGTIIGNTSIGATLGKNATLSGASFSNCSWGVMGGPGSLISGCNFEKCGSGILLADDVSVINCSFRNCYAGILAGTGARISSNSNISECLFWNCSWGVFCGPATNLLNCVFQQCNVGIEAIDIPATVHIDDCSFQNGLNAIMLVDVTSTYINKCHFSDGAGDAVQWKGGYVEINDCLFEAMEGPCLNGTGGRLRAGNSEFNSNGTAVRAVDLTDCTIDHCDIFGPQGDNSGNDAIVETGGQIIMNFSTITGGGTQLRVRSGRTIAQSTTFLSERAVVMEGAVLEVRWLVNVFVLYGNGSPAPYSRLNLTNQLNHSVDMPTSNGTLVFSGLMEYLKTYNETIYYSPYWFNASDNGLTCNLSVNVNRSMDVEMMLRDSSMPAVNITSPVNGSFMNRSTVIVKGTASDETGNVSVRVRVDSGDWMAAGGAGNWSILLNLTDGTHIIEAEAQDNASNRATASVTITIDTVPPAIKIMEPAQDLLVNTTSIEMTGLTEPGAALWVDGEVVPVSLGAFRMNKQLREGPNRILLLARDNAGNTANAELRILRDTFPPALAVSTPLDGSFTNRSVITVSGTAEAGAQIFFGSAMVATAGPFFSFNVSVLEGANNVSVKAVDLAGNKNTVTIHLTVDTRPPFIEVDVVNGTVTRADAIILTGRTEPGAGLSINGLSVAVGTNGSFRTNITLHLGTNNISVLAQDAAGNIATLQRTIVKAAREGPRPDSGKGTGGTSWKPEWTIAALIVAIAVVILYMAIRPNKGLGAPPPKRKGGGL